MSRTNFYIIGCNAEFVKRLAPHSAVQLQQAHLAVDFAHRAVRKAGGTGGAVLEDFVHIRLVGQDAAILRLHGKDHFPR